MSGHADRTVRLWNAKKGVLVKTYEGVQNREVFDIAIFQDNGRFASCGGDKTFFKIWDILNPQQFKPV